MIAFWAAVNAKEAHFGQFLQTTASFGVAGGATCERRSRATRTSKSGNGIELSLRAYDVIGMLPSSERYEMCSQMRRCVVSIPANIAEGHARRRPKPYLNHVYIALGSLAEWATYLVIANRLGYITSGVFEGKKREADRLGQMLHALARSLESRIERLKLGLALCGFALSTIGAAAFLTLG